jgi:hypothetical protein
MICMKQTGQTMDGVASGTPLLASLGLDDEDGDALQEELANWVAIWASIRVSQKTRQIAVSASWLSACITLPLPRC